MAELVSLHWWIMIEWSDESKFDFQKLIFMFFFSPEHFCLLWKKRCPVYYLRPSALGNSHATLKYFLYKSLKTNFSENQMLSQSIECLEVKVVNYNITLRYKYTSYTLCACIIVYFGDSHQWHDWFISIGKCTLLLIKFISLKFA